MFTERRKHARAAIMCRITMISDLKILAFNADIQNIGEGGMRVILEQKLDVGTPVDLEIFPVDKKIVIKCKGEIIWVNERFQEKKHNPVFDTGIKFSGMHAADKAEIKNLVLLSGFEER